MGRCETCNDPLSQNQNNKPANCVKCRVAKHRASKRKVASEELLTKLAEVVKEERAKPRPETKPKPSPILLPAPEGRTEKTRPSLVESPVFTHSAKATQYARDVVEGRVLACKWVKLACQRHLKDLVRAKSGWDFYFDEARANHACRFIEELPHTKGSWASKGELIRLEPWQCFIVCSIFGWMKSASRTRRFNRAMILTPRKNAKSTLAAAIGVYMFAADGEFGSIVHCGATTEAQAWEVFGPALDMVKRTPDLMEAYNIEPHPRLMIIPSNGSQFKPVIGKPGDGPSIHCGIVDEYHEHADATLYDTFNTGMGARTQPLELVVTTAGDNTEGPCRALQSTLEQVLEGTITQDEFFGIVYTIDVSDDWTTEEALRKANPNYDVSVYGWYLKNQQSVAVSDARKQGIFKTKHLDVWVGALHAYFNVEAWKNLADTSLDRNQFRGALCIAALDLSSKVDITARVVVFRKRLSDDKDHFYVFGTFYLPEQRAAKPEFQHYQGWVSEGWLQTTPGGSIDYQMIEDDTVKEMEALRVKELAYDEWGAKQLAQNVDKRTRAEVVEIPQRANFLSEPMKMLDALIMDGRVHHDGNPVLTWMMGNVKAKEDANENVLPRKESGRAEAKIDGAVALIMAMSRALVSKGTSSVYATRGLLQA
jgi:phage terminase large subunit-like protein